MREEIEIVLGLVFIGVTGIGFVNGIAQIFDKMKSSIDWSIVINTVQDFALLDWIVILLVLSVLYNIRLKYKLIQQD